MNWSQQFGLGSVLLASPGLTASADSCHSIRCSTCRSALQASVTFGVMSHLPLVHWPKKVTEPTQTQGMEK